MSETMTLSPLRRRVFGPLVIAGLVAAGCVARGRPAAYTPVTVDLPAYPETGVPALRPDAARVGRLLPDRPVPPAGPPAVREVDVRAEAPRDRHVVAPGETLTAIARQNLGDAGRWREIVALNPGLSPDRMSVGASLILPR